MPSLKMIHQADAERRAPGGYPHGFTKEVTQHRQCHGHLEELRGKTMIQEDPQFFLVGYCAGCG